VLAPVVIMRHYRTSLTIESVAKLLASSPRQLQRAFAQFSESTFRADLQARRMAAAAELLSQPAIQVCEVARQVGYRQPSHFARVFRCLYGVPPAAFRSELHQPRRSETRGVIAT
jgi:AraC-like DNA-binding protein